MSLASYTLGELRRRPGRTALTLIGIAIGVSSIVAIMICTQTTRSAYRTMFEQLTGRAELEVVAEAYSGFDPAIVAQLAHTPGVAAAIPVVQTSTALITPAGASGVMALGIDPQQDTAARDYEFRAGRMLQSGKEVLLAANVAESNDWKLGSKIRIMAPAGVTALEVVGLLEPVGPAASKLGGVVILPLATAQELFRLGSQINGVQLVLQQGAVSQQVERDIAPTLPAGLTVQVPATRSQMAHDSLFATEQGLEVMSAVSLVAGTFVILNVFLMNLGERRKQFAILRALGATHRQITRLLLVEAALLGLLGTALGMILGIGVAVVFVRGMEQFLRMPLSRLEIGWPPFIAALVLGPTAALAAAYIPSRRESNRPPLDALLDRHANRDEHERRWTVKLGLAMITSTFLILIAMLAGWLAPATITLIVPPSMALFLIGAVLALPLVITPLLNVAGRIFEPLLGIEAVLARRQLERHRPRTSLTVGVLVIAMVITVGMGNSLLNNVHDVGDWQKRTVTVDFLVRSVLPDTGLMIAAAMPDHLRDDVAALPGIQRVDRLAFVPAKAQDRQSNDRQVLVLAKTLQPNDPITFDLSSGDPAQIVERLRQGEVVIGTVLAGKLQLQAGDTITLNTKTGEQMLKIAGTSDEYTAGGMAIYMDWNYADERLGVAGADVLMITAEKGRFAEAKTALDQFCRERHLMLQTQEDFGTFLDHMVQQVTGFLWMLMALAFVVASLGIVNTLTMNVLEQTRELGVLRAVAMQRRQIRKLILAQAGALGLVAVIPGVVVGIFLATMISLATFSVSGHAVGFAIDVLFVAQTAIAGFGISLLAALLPAERAARLEIVRALQYE
jgi:putative ABC transport system permease protein